MVEFDQIPGNLEIQGGACYHKKEAIQDVGGSDYTAKTYREQGDDASDTISPAKSTDTGCSCPQWNSDASDSNLPT